MKDFELGISDIKELMESFRKNSLTSFKLKNGGFELELGADGTETAKVIMPPSAGYTSAVEISAAAVQQAAPAGNVVTAPIVGTFYSSPGPDKEPYVAVGSKVKKGDVLFIIESMKLMNEVTSEFDGTVSSISAENASPVEFGQQIMIIE